MNRPAVATALCFVACALVIALLPLGLYPALLFIVLGLLFGVPGGLVMKLPADVLAPENRAAGMGVYFACYYAGMAALTPVAGLLRDATGSASAPILVGAGVMAAAALSLGLFRALQHNYPRPLLAA
jgi:predicted MFS family arabinose efflux permease